MAVVQRFEPAMARNPYETLLGLKQEGTVEAYTEQFERFVGALKGVDEDYLIGIYLNGLKGSIRAEVKLCEFSSLADLMAKALLAEDKNKVLKGGDQVGGHGQDTSTRQFQGTRTYSFGTGWKNHDGAASREGS